MIVKRNGIIFVLVVMLLLSACGNEGNAGDTKSNKSPIDLADINPIDSLGNQFNSSLDGEFCINSKKWIYGEAHDKIIKTSIDDVGEYNDIYYEGIDGLGAFSIYNGWIYFLKQDDDEGVFFDDETSTVNLYRVKKGSSRKEKIAESVYQFLVAEEGIYYESNPRGSNKKIQPGIYLLSLDGSNSQKIVDEEVTLLGADEGWLYYKTNELYRVKPNGSEKGKVRDIFNLDKEVLFSGSADNFLIYHDCAFFIRDNDYDQSELVMKPVGEEEIILVSDISHLGPINIYDDWLYYYDKNSIFRINIMKKGEPSLFYKFKKNIELYNILLNKKGALISTFDEASYFIKSNGEIINLSELGV